MDPITIALLASAAGGGVWWLRKKHPEKLPKFLQPKGMQAGGAANAKNAAIQSVINTSAAATPHPTTGLDAGMTTSQVDSANQLLASATDANALYAMASSYSEMNFVKTAQALIAKADALSHAKAQGASDAELLHQMTTAATASSPTTSQQVASQLAAGGANVSVSPDGTITMHSGGDTVEAPAAAAVATTAVTDALFGKA